MYTTASRYQRANFDVNQTMNFRMLSDDQCEEIFVTALELLERSGAKIENQKALQVLKDGGCWVKGDIVRFPSAKVEWAVRTAPSRVTLCNRDGKRAMLLETENNHFGPALSASQLIEDDGTRRAFTKEDAADVARLCQRLNNIEFAASGGTVASDDSALANVYAMESLLKYTDKPIVQSACCESQAKILANMVAAVSPEGNDALRENPRLVLQAECSDSLIHSEDGLSVVMYAAEQGIPCIYSSCVVSGYNAPLTAAGTLVIALANALAGLVVSQLTAPGAPFIAGATFSINDTKSEAKPITSPEGAQCVAGFANLLRWAKIPSFGIGGNTDAQASDAQSGLETCFGILTAQLSGTNLVSCGLFGGGDLFSKSLLVLNDELVQEIRRAISGFEIDEERMARGVIEEIGPGGYYLGTDHTSRFFKLEQHWPHLISRKRIDDWTNDGAKSLGVRAAEATNSLLSVQEESLLDVSALKALGDVVAQAEKK